MAERVCRAICFRLIPWRIENVISIPERVSSQVSAGLGRMFEQNLRANPSANDKFNPTKVNHRVNRVLRPQFHFQDVRILITSTSPTKCGIFHDNH